MRPPEGRSYVQRHSAPRRPAPEENSMSADTSPRIVLVHGGFVDGSGWQGVHDLLTADGFRVSVVQHATFSLADDVEATRRVLDAQDGPTVLVGHSYGGAVVSEVG